MGTVYYYPNTSQISQQWNDATQTVTQYAPDGTITSTRPYTAAEIAQAATSAATVTTMTNQATIQANILTRQAQIQAWISTHPTGAVLTAAQTLTLAQMLNGLCQLLLQQYGSTNLT